MARALDQPMAHERTRRVASEIGRRDNTRNHGLEARCTETDADQGSDIAVGQLDQADSQYKRSDSGENGAHVIPQESDPFEPAVPSRCNPTSSCRGTAAAGIGSQPGKDGRPPG